MSAPSPDGGASSSKSEDPGTSTNGNTKIYPKRKGLYQDHDYLDVMATVFKYEPETLNFHIRIAADSAVSEWPTEEGGNELELGWVGMRDEGHCAVGAKYRVRFRRYPNSRETVPYWCAMTYDVRPPRSERP